MPFKKGQTTRLGMKNSEEHNKKIGNANRGKIRTKELRHRLSMVHIGKRVGTENHEWKGDNVTYYALHHWVRKHLGKPGECVYCGKENTHERDGRSAIQWANIDHQYTRKLEDYIPLCRKCHREHDNNLNK